MTMPELPLCETLLDLAQPGTASEVTVVIPLHNYAQHITAALAQLPGSAAARQP